MNLIAAWRRHVAGPSGSELEQALLRVSIALVVTIYVWWYVSREAGFIDEHRITLTALAVWIILAIGMVAAIWRWPSANVARRMLGILADVGAITFGLFVGGEGGVSLVGLYFFIIFGNGFRYGRLYLHVTQLLSLIGFVLAVSMVPWGGHELHVAIALLMWMIVLPFYVGVLAQRINVARMKAEEALKECIERQRGDAI